MDDAIHDMRTVPSPSIKATLRARLQRNEPVLQYLPEVRRFSYVHIAIALDISYNIIDSQAFAVLITPMSGSSPVDLFPVVKHAATIADEACYLTGETSADVSKSILFQT
jgi:ubiquinone biosynthesis protein COQ9